MFEVSIIIGLRGKTCISSFEIKETKKDNFVM